MGKNVQGHFVSGISGWRHAAIGAWNSPGDPTMYGVIEVDVSKSLAFLEEFAERTGHRLTLTHLVSKALADALAAHPECNAYVRFGRIYQREEVDIFVLVAVPPEKDSGTKRGKKTDLSGVAIQRADTKSIVQIAKEVAAAAASVRTTGKESLGGLKRVMRALPPSLTRIGIKLVSFLQYDLNFDLSSFGVPRDSFGAAIVSNMGMLGIRLGFPPLVPMMRLSLLAGVGEVEDRAVVVDGKIVIRPILPLTATLDHRVVDGYQAGLIAQAVKRILEDPGTHLA